jgi:hypothetical protein
MIEVMIHLVKKSTMRTDNVTGGCFLVFPVKGEPASLYRPSKRMIRERKEFLRDEPEPTQTINSNYHGEDPL